MVILKVDNLDNIPKNAIVLTESEAIEKQWDSINEHASEMKV